MSDKLKVWLVIILLASTGVLSFTIPAVKYEGTGFISRLKMPSTLANWKGVDVSEKLNVSLGEGPYSFISDIIAYQYVNERGDKLLFIILDAGNFHDPKVCFTGAGYKINETYDTKFDISGRTLNAHTLLTEKGGENFISYYWIVIDKNIAGKWIEHKLKQLFFSLFNKKRVGLMIRMDISVAEVNIDDAMTIAEDFIIRLRRGLPQEEADYIFGEY